MQELKNINQKQSSHMKSSNIKNKILKKLKDTLSHMKELREEQFDYSQYISEFDIENKCGTVCCVAGWLPIWFPKDFKFGKTLCCGDVVFIPEPKQPYIGDIQVYLSEYYEIDNKIIRMLFYGENVTKNVEVILENDLNNTLPNVIKIWEKVIELIENEVIEYL
jgi:hypothetical protein